MPESNPKCTNQSVESAFLDAMRAAGIEYSGPIIADKKLHSVKANGNRTAKTWYVLHPDGLPAGSFGDHKLDIKKTWCAKSNDVLTDEERAERDRRWKQQAEARDAERRRQHDKAGIEAQAILDAAQPATDDHPYLQRKHVHAYPGVLVGSWPQRKIDNALLVPLRTAAGQLASVEAIFPNKIKIRGEDSDKDFLKGGAKAGAFFVIGDLEESPFILICEGYATAATVHEATGYAAVMACDAGNLAAVTAALKALYPHPKVIMVCGDNDRKTDVNTGQKAALAVSKKSKVRVCIPDFADDEEGSDFNDLAALHGLDRVWNEIESALHGPWRAGKEGKPSGAAQAVASESQRPVIEVVSGTEHTMANEAPEPASVAAVPDSESGAFTRHDPRLMRKSGSSELLKNLSNAITIVENAYPGLVGYNEFRQRIEARFPTKWRKGAGAWTEYDTAELADSIAHRGFPSFNMELLSNAVMTVAHRNPFNPAQDKLRALAAQWDGVERLAAWLVDYLNAGRSDANADYLREIGAAWLKGVVARVLFPGCKRDDVLVLRGPQGWCKSTAANCIAECIHPDSFTDNLGDLSSKDSRAGIRGMVIAELAELAALNKSDIESVKAFVAGRNDHFREAYGRGERDYPRTVSFIGTTNDPTFLKDPSGNRRWWPVTITAPIDIPRLEAALPQLLGEAASRVLSGEAWHVKDERALAQANDVRAAHYADDAWTDVVLDSSKSLLRDKPPQSQYVTIAELMGVMGLRIEQQTVPVQMRIGGILRVNQFESKRKRLDGRLAWVWVPGIPPLDGGYTRGIQQTPSETADVPPYPPVSPTLEHFVENDRSGGREDTADPPNLGIYRNEADMGDAGGTPSETAGSSCIPPSVSPTKGGNSKPVDTPPCTDISADIPIAPPAESQGTPTTCKAKTPDIARADPRRSAPPVCLPSTGYPFRYVTKCDKPTPIMPESGYGDPVGCSHCGQRWGARP